MCVCVRVSVYWCVLCVFVCVYDIKSVLAKAVSSEPNMQ